MPRAWMSRAAEWTSVAEGLGERYPPAPLVSGLTNKSRDAHGLRHRANCLRRHPQGMQLVAHRGGQDV